MKTLAAILQKSLLFITILLASLLLAPSAQACFAPSPEQTAPWQELVKRTSTIVLVETVSAKPLAKSAADFGNTEYTLKVVEALKGKAPTTTAKTLKLIGNPPPKSKGTEKIAEAHFAAHQNGEFWKDNTGRILVGPDCLITPRFLVGQKYLLFVEKPYHVKSFENVSAEGDLWLQKVRAQLASPAADSSDSSQSGTSQTAPPEEN